MRPFHRRNADELRRRITSAVLAAEELAFEADIAADRGDLSTATAHQFRMVLRVLNDAEARIRHACDIAMATEPWEAYSSKTYREAS